MKNRITLIFAIAATAIICLSFGAQSQTPNNDNIVLHSARFLGDGKFLDIDATGLHFHSDLIATLTFYDQPRPERDYIVIGSTTFNFVSSRSQSTDILVAKSLDETIDNTRYAIDAAHVVTKTLRIDNAIRLSLAETQGITLTSSQPPLLSFSSFVECGS